jgi:hypothetical protein
MKVLFVLNCVFICFVRKHQLCFYCDGENGHSDGCNMQEVMLIIIEKIYITAYAIVGYLS